MPAVMQACQPTAGWKEGQLGMDQAPQEEAKPSLQESCRQQQTSLLDTMSVHNAHVWG